jgi:hypothetical protein
MSTNSITVTTDKTTGVVTTPPTNIITRRPHILFIQDITIKATRKNKQMAYISTATALPSIIYKPLPKKFTTLEMWPKSTNLKCWSCDLNFDNIPIFLPTNIYNESGQITMDVHGVFCWFPCAVRYLRVQLSGDNLSNDRFRMLLALYKVIVGKSVVYIPQGVDKCCRQEFCGDDGLTVQMFQKKLDDQAKQIV